MNVTCKCGVFSLLAILTLRDARIYVGASDDDNVWTDVEIPVD